MQYWPGVQKSAPHAAASPGLDLDVPNATRIADVANDEQVGMAWLQPPDGIEPEEQYLEEGGVSVAEMGGAEGMYPYDEPSHIHSSQPTKGWSAQSEGIHSNGGPEPAPVTGEPSEGEKSNQMWDAVARGSF